MSIDSVVKSASFPSSQKLADVTPFHKKVGKDMIENYRPVSILLTLSQNLEKYLLKCLLYSITFFESTVSYSKRIQYSILLEMWKRERTVDKVKVIGDLLTDLSKGFDCPNHELLTAKLNAFGFSLPAL